MDRLDRGVRTLISLQTSVGANPPWKQIRTLFEMADDDNSGFLDEEEVGRLHKRLFKEFPAIVVSFDPPFDLASDFAEMDRVRVHIIGHARNNM